MRRLVAAFDKFRGTATARELVTTVCEITARAGWACRPIALADGGEGTLDALSEPRHIRRTIVTGPLGTPVEARWSLASGTAVIEAAEACGLERAGGPGGNDPLGATTAGVGELIAEAIGSGATRVIVGIGGSATTDGGLGAIRALPPRLLRAKTEIVVACDVTTVFVDAPRVFAPQKGATSSQVALLARRLDLLAARYASDYHVDVRELAGSGAGGGLAGGLAAALGASLVSGAEMVAEACGVPDAVAGADLVLTGEGTCDATSFVGKVAGHVVALAGAAGVPAVVLAGRTELEGVELQPGTEVISLVERFGEDRAEGDPLGCVRDVVMELLQARSEPACGPYP